jgi:hypothetical protein
MVQPGYLISKSAEGWGKEELYVPSRNSTKYQLSEMRESNSVWRD